MNKGFVNIGISKDTSEFACDSIKAWWKNIGKKTYPNADSILILADGGGSNSSRHYIFKEDLQKLVDEIADNWKNSSITEVQTAMCLFAEKLTLQPSTITQLDIDTLSDFDLSDKEISEIVQIVSYFNYINRVADGLGLEPEDFIDEKGYKIN